MSCGGKKSTLAIVKTKKSYKVSKVNFFLVISKCIPSFHFIVISKRIKLQRCDCAQLVDFSMKFLKLFLFFRFGHRKVFKSDVTGEVRPRK